MVPYDEEEELGCFPSENNFEVDTEEDLFQTISEECQSRDKRGLPVIESLAKLADNFLSKKIDDKDKEKFDQYLPPRNIEFVETPQVNRPIWGNLSQESKRNDVSLQLIQPGLSFWFTSYFEST